MEKADRLLDKREYEQDGWPAEMTEEDIVDALYDLGGYSPEGTAVLRAFASLRSRLAAAEGELANERKVCLKLAERVDGVAREAVVREDRLRSLLERAEQFLTDDLWLAMGHQHFDPTGHGGGGRPSGCVSCEGQHEVSDKARELRAALRALLAEMREKETE